MSDFSTWDVIRNLLKSLPWTFFLSAVAFIGGGVLGLLLLVLRIMKPRSLGRVIAWYVQLFQGTPLLMQLFLTYFGLALFGLQTTPYWRPHFALSSMRAPI